jgi:hypothetical protein
MAVTQATRPAVLAEPRVAALAVAHQHAQPRGPVAVAALADLPVQVPAVLLALVQPGLVALAQAHLVAAELAVLLVRARRVASLPRAGLRVPVLPVVRAVLLQASAHLALRRAEHRVVVEHRAVLRAVATTGR